MEKKIIKAIELLLADIKKMLSQGASPFRNQFRLSECRFRILEGYLEWYLDLLKDELKCVNCGTTKR